MPAPEEFASVESTAAPDFYTWTFPGAPVRIHLHLNAVERLSREVRRAFESIPSHSVEIGGLLLGTADFYASPIIEVKDFEPFLCEYRPDHKYILSDSDRRKLEKALAARRSKLDDGLTVVGYYRSQIGGNLSLSEHDLSIAQAYFYDPASVFMLIKPSSDGTSSAGFFFWDNGHIDSEFTFLEFPFDARLLTGARVKPSPLSSSRPEEADAPDDQLAPADPDPYAQPVILQEPQAAEEKRHSSTLRWLWYPLFAALMIAVGALGYPAYLQWLAARTPAPAPLVSDVPALTLQVERRGNDLRVSWNRNAPAVHRAREAVLSIRDGDAQLQDLRLELDQLHNGSVLYTPANSTVQFRLEVTGDDGKKLSETVLALTAAPGAAIGNNAAALKGRQPSIARPATGSAPPSSTANFKAAPPRDKKAFTPPTATRDFGEPVRVVSVDPPQPDGNAPAQPSALTGQQGSQPRLGQPPAPQLGPGGQANNAQSPGAAPAYVAARPIRQSQPVLPATIRATVTSEVEVQIKVQIDVSGRVVKADAVASTGPVSSFLVSAARNAALLWRFAPAMRGGQSVPSEMVLKFQYRPARAAN